MMDLRRRAEKGAIQVGCCFCKHRWVWIRNVPCRTPQRLLPIRHDYKDLKGHVLSDVV